MSVCEDYSDSQVEKEPSMDEVNKLDWKRYIKSFLEVKRTNFRGCAETWCAIRDAKVGDGYGSHLHAA